MTTSTVGLENGHIRTKKKKKKKNLTKNGETQRHSWEYKQTNKKEKKRRKIPWQIQNYADRYPSANNNNNNKEG